MSPIAFTRPSLREVFACAMPVLAALLQACGGGTGGDGVGGNTGSHPTVTLTPSAMSVLSGASITLNWSSSNASACTASGGWSGSRPTSGSETSAGLSATTAFTLSCTGSAGTANASTTVTVTQPAAPAVTLAATPTSVASGGASTLSWTSTNATSCTASGGWSGGRATSGSASTGALSAPASYTLTCNGQGGSASASAGVAVSASVPAPTVALSANPASVASGGSSTLSWTSTNATSCTASGGWSGSRATSGSASTGALSAASTFTLSCTGTGGTTSASTTVALSGTGTMYGLDWPGDGASRRMLYWSNPFPIYDATYVFKVFPRKKTVPSMPNGYYTTFFWGNNGSFSWDNGNANTYYGAHPYPVPAPNGPGQWEISAYASDYVTGSEVVWNRWYTQAFRAWRESASVTHHEFYYDLPDTSKVIRTTITSPGWATRNPPAPALVIGQAPNVNGVSWGGYPGWEEFNGIIRGVQIYSGLLTLNDILAEINTPQSTDAGRNFIWYLNLNPRPGDVSDKKTGGTPHHPAWDGGTAREWSQ